MGWIKHVIVDVIITVCIVLATVGGQVWAAWVVWIYTPFLLLLKLGAVGVRTPRMKKKPGPTVPEVFYHVIYAISVVIPLAWGFRQDPQIWWWVAAGWIAIWVLSVVASSRSKPSA